MVSERAKAFLKFFKVHSGDEGSSELDRVPSRVIDRRQLFVTFQDDAFDIRISDHFFQQLPNFFRSRTAMAVDQVIAFPMPTNEVKLYDSFARQLPQEPSTSTDRKR